jgi:transmembrane sensor
MTPSDKEIRLAIAEQASAWFVDNRDGALDRDARARFIAWLRASPVHVGEYLAIAALACDLKTAAKGTEIPLDTLLARARQADQLATLNPSGRLSVTTHSRVPRLWLFAAAATLACIALTTLLMTRNGERFGLPKTYRTAHGEQTKEMLPDGSVLHLNTDSQVTVHYSSRERLIVLDRGEALFEVLHTERGFRVVAGNAQVLDVGTQFDVYRKTNSVLITVVDGTVAVYTGPPQPTPTALSVSAGYQVEVGGQVGVPRPVDVRAAVGWLERQIAFENQPLGDVAKEFNRYGHVPIEIDSQELRSLHITGVFDAYDTDSFVAFLATLDGVLVKKTPIRIRVLNRADHREPLPVTH